MKRGILFIAAALLSATVMTFAFGDKVEASQELYTVTQGGFSTLVEPLSQAESAGLFYGYNTTYYASAYTGFETSSKSLLFLYRDASSGELSLFMIHDRYLDNGGGNTGFDFAGIPEGASWSVKDDPESLGDRYYTGAHYLGWAARWGWSPCCTDGGVIGGIDGFSEITITPWYWSGINTWVFLTGDASNPTFISLPSLTQPVTISLAVISVPIDIKPGSDPNSININSRGVIPVAVLTTDEFNAQDVNAGTVRFGPAGAYAEQYALEDVDDDGDVDLILHFRTQDAGIAAGDTEAVLTGETLEGRRIEGSDSVRVRENKGRKK